jgi:aminopeptidase N
MTHVRTHLAALALAITTLAACHTSAGAAEHAEYCRYCRTVHAAAAATDGSPRERHYAPERHVDILHIKLDVTPDFAKRSVAGTATIRFAPIAKPLEELRLDGVNLRVSAVRSSHKVRDWSSDAKDVTINFEAAIPADENAWVEIDYAAEPLEGLYFRTPEMGYPASDAHCWTQGETHEARHWFPCFDYPNERSSTELICHVPADMTVVSNGKLVSESEDDGVKTYHWLQEKPHVSYLICFVAGRLEKLEAKHRDVPLGFYSQPSKAEHAESAFGDTADIMAFFEQEIGVEFPWDKYDQATIADFMWGGMENTSMTTLTQRTLFENPSDSHRAARARGLNAHEMAHQWFGDYVTCKDWSHLWLNEGFATYYAHLYEGHKAGRDAMLYGLYLDARDEILLPENVKDTRPIVYREYDKPGDQFDFRNYPKGSWVLHMLRSRVGEKLFREAIHTYLQRHALGEVVTDDLREVFEELSGEPLDRFFDQWLYQGGAPELKVTYEWLAKEKLAHITVSQTQSQGTLAYELPTKVRFIVDGKAIDESIEITGREHDFYVPLPAAPTTVRFDPEYTLLAKIAFEKSDALLQADLKNANDAIGRIMACEALGKRRTASSTAALKTALQNDMFFGVRQAAARALREQQMAAATAALIESLDQDDLRVRRSVVDELGQCFDGAAGAKLLEIAADDNQPPAIAAAAVAALGRSADDDAEGVLRDALKSTSFNNERAAAALLAIRETGDASWTPTLIEILSQRQADIDSADLREGFLTLAKLAQRGRRQAAAYEFLASQVENPREPLRLAAVEALGELHDARARVLLEPFTAAGQNERLMLTSKRALAVLDAKDEFVPAEIGALRSALTEMREEQEKLKGQLKKLESKSAATKDKPSAVVDDGAK